MQEEETAVQEMAVEQHISVIILVLVVVVEIMEDPVS
jgi:hypothetical protein